MFREFGTVKVVRICTKDSKGRLPTWLTLGCMNPNSHHAYVEFNEEHEAIKATQASSLLVQGKDQDIHIKVHRLTDRLEYLANHPPEPDSPSPSPSPVQHFAPTIKWNNSSGVGSGRSSRDSSPGSNNTRWGPSLVPRSSVDHVIAPSLAARRVTGLPPHPSIENQRWHRRTSPTVPPSLMVDTAVQPRVVGLTHGGILTTESEALLSKHSSEERPSWGSDRPSHPSSQQGGLEAYVPPSRRSRDNCPSPAPPSPLPQQFTLESLAASLTAAGSPYSPVTAFHAMSPSPPPPSQDQKLDQGNPTTLRVALSAMISEVKKQASETATIGTANAPKSIASIRRASSSRGEADKPQASQASEVIGRLLIGIPPLPSAHNASLKPPLCARKTTDDAALKDVNQGRRLTAPHVLKPAPPSSDTVMTRRTNAEGQLDTSLSLSSSVYCPASSDQMSRCSSTIASEGSGLFNSYGPSEEGEDEDDEYGGGGEGLQKRRRSRRGRGGRKTADLVDAQVAPLASSRRMTTGCVESRPERSAPLITLPPTFPAAAVKKDYATWAPAVNQNVSVAAAYVVSKGPDGTRGFAGGRERSKTLA